MMDLVVARRLDATHYACTQPPHKGVIKLTWAEICQLTEIACQKMYRDSRAAGSAVTLHVMNTTWPGRTAELGEITYHLSLERPLARMPDPSQAVCTHIPATTPRPATVEVDLGVFWSKPLA